MLIKYKHSEYNAITYINTNNITAFCCIEDSNTIAIKFNNTEDEMVCNFYDSTLEYHYFRDELFRAFNYKE